jgi:microcystin-dependent protein
MTSYCRRYLNFGAHERPTVGDIKISFTGFDHLGWIKCDGTYVSKTEYALLYNVIGDKYGSSGDLFRLPDAQGRVTGIVGTPSGAVGTAHAIGTVTGTETHTLIINEMPAHKHGSVDVGGNSNGDGNTTTNGAHNHTGSTGNAGAHTHTATDSGHTHGYFNQPNSHQVAVSATTTGTADDTNENQTTGIGNANITVAGVADHSHTISTDGAHFHTMGSTGGGAAHNNMQPTLFVGNMFVYTGKTQYGYFPYATGPNLF